MTMTLSGDGTITGLVAGGLPNATVTADDLASGAAVSNIGYTPTNQQAENINFRNRIINGDMRIDQRNAGAAVTATDSYTLDRWKISEDTDGAASVQQVSDAPSGFNNSAKVTVTTEDASIGASQFVLFWQPIEGFNWADLGYGAAGAKTSTLSFWAKSSLTGTFSGALESSDGGRSYIFSYTINAANTWEYKTVTIAGDTSGTWVGSTNGIGVKVFFTLTAGATFQGTPGSWGATRFGATGTTQLMSTLNATWQLTGVQLEVGSVATPFERRPYGAELSLCERYFQRLSGAAWATGSATTQCGTAVTFKTEMRASPSVGLTAALQVTQVGDADFTQSAASINIPASGVRVNTLGVSLACPNFTGLPTNAPLPAIVGGGIVTFSAEL
jgi:hypothetical protein